MSVEFVIANRGGLHAVIRVLPSGEAAGYDPVADREQQQVHFRIYKDTPHATAIDAAFCDSRKYASREAAEAAAAKAGRTAAG